MRYLILILFTVHFVHCSDTGACDITDYIGQVSGSFVDGQCNPQMLPSNFELVEDVSASNDRLLGVVNGEIVYEVQTNGMGTAGCNISLRAPRDSDFNLFSDAGLITRSGEISFIITVQDSAGNETDCEYIGSIAQ